MKFFVTGATGFIGTRLCARLLDLGHEAVVLVRPEALFGRFDQRGVEVVEGDLSLFKDEGLVLPACDVVVHLAAATSVRHEREYDELNYRAVKDLVSCLARQAWRPRRLLFASSLAAAGPSPTGAPLDEAAECRPMEPYGRAKRAAEEFLAAADLPCTSFRPPIVTGAGSRDAETFLRIGSWGVGPIPGSDQPLSFVDVDDLVDAILQMSLDRSDESKLYFVSHPSPASGSEIWRAVSRVVGKPVRTFIVPRWLLRLLTRVAAGVPSALLGAEQLNELRQLERRQGLAFVCSSSKIERELGWVPSVGLEASLERAFSREGFRHAAAALSSIA